MLHAHLFSPHWRLITVVSESVNKGKGQPMADRDECEVLSLFRYETAFVFALPVHYSPSLHNTTALMSGGEMPQGGALLREAPVTVMDARGRAAPLFSPGEHE
ncbi:hypothetical protein CDAR_290021 [Caerostris darwini]|uniref:Uncharacterized protein n=1 Tax=Caerostris darwini TaxID=1538125 RepID=A0AAV4WXJ6_9ARAC|nr:hypothetical protein CDAR_290021 [Caerostris darwini]